MVQSRVPREAAWVFTLLSTVRLLATAGANLNCGCNPAALEECGKYAIALYVNVLSAEKCPDFYYLPGPPAFFGPNTVWEAKVCPALPLHPSTFVSTTPCVAGSDALHLNH